MDASERPVVETEYGRVRGLRLHGLEQYIEIPYGASTGGTRRFRAPQAPLPWSDIREANRWTTRAAQNHDNSPGRTPRQWFALQGKTRAPEGDEDCLTLNVWTPSSADGKRRPVVVWVHGGGWVVGQAGQDMSDGAAFAREHDAVFVSVTHRLNAFGFLALDRIAGPEFRGSGNAGLLDLVASLRWIRSNIARFGGDPGRVTLVGESGGGGKVSALLVMPEARGLFHAALCQSGVTLEVRTREDSEEYARRLIAQLGGDDHEVLLRASTEEFLAAQAEIERIAGTPTLGPIADEDVLPASPLEMWKRGEGSDVPVIAGTMHDEVRVFAGPDQPFPVDIPNGDAVASDEAAPFDFDAGITAAEKVAGRQLGPARDILQRLRSGITERETAMVLLGEAMFRYPTIKFAELRAAHGMPTWVYQGDWASPKIEPLGAPHSSGVALFFGNDDLLYFTRGLPDAHRLARQMSGALAALMVNGAPTAEGLPAWPTYEPNTRAVMVFDDPSHVVYDPDGALREAFAAVDPRLQH